MDTLIVLLRIAAVLHVGLLGAGLMMPKIVGMPAHLGRMPPFIEQLFWVYYAFIGLCLVGFGAMTFVFADTLASGSSLARAVCTFFAVFWTMRLIAAIWIFDVRPYLTTRARRWGYRGLSLAFACLPVVYGVAALQPTWLR